MKACQRDQAFKRLLRQGIKAGIEVVSAPSPGKGTCLFLLAEFKNIAAGFGSLGAIGKRAEQVADEACNELFAYRNADGALDPHLADQIIPWLVLARGASAFTTTRITTQLLTNAWVTRQFSNRDICVEGIDGEPGRISVSDDG